VLGLSQYLQHIDKEKLDEMAMVDIAYEILRETNQPYNFRELMKEIAHIRGLTEEQMMAMIAQVYTEVNIDGRFVCIGDNTWGLKRWYPTETVEENQETGGKKKKLVADDDFDYEDEEDLVVAYEEDDLVPFDDEEDPFLADDDVDDLDELDDEDALLEDDEEIFEEEDEFIEEDLEEDIEGN
jgi:DNA-directed RNA polymerase subunit delta